MKLIGTMTPYSSVVGGGITLLDEDSRPAYLIMIVGTTKGINKEVNNILSAQICALINDHGLEL